MTHPATYNATVVEIRKIHSTLWIIRLRTDEIRTFIPGQYFVLGLLNSENVRADCPGSAVADGHEMIRRAYSVSARMVDQNGDVLHPFDDDCLEFYVALVRGTDEHPAQLTPRLFALRPGARLFVGDRAHGNYVATSVRSDHDLIFVATGTGEAPHNAMIVDLLSRGHTGRIVAVTGARFEKDLGYLQQHRILEAKFANYRYMTQTTREAWNVDASHPRYVGKQYLPDFFLSGRFSEQTELVPDPRNCHVFLCGNPGMVGAPTGNSHESSGLCRILEERGFVRSHSGVAGNLHFEQYGS